MTNFVLCRNAWGICSRRDPVGQVGVPNNHTVAAVMYGNGTAALGGVSAA